MIDQWLDIIRREAALAVASRIQKSTLVATSYDAKNHLVKGILVPHGVETGWIPITSHHIGNGYGILVGPKIGDAQKLDGDQFDIGFEFGDPDTPVARHRLFSKVDQPPEVQSGEMLLQHEKGHKLFFAQDGSVTLFHAAKNGEITFDKDGHLTLDAKGQNLTVQSAGGQVNIKGTIAINGS